MKREYEEYTEEWKEARVRASRNHKILMKTVKAYLIPSHYTKERERQFQKRTQKAYQQIADRLF